MSEVTSKQIWQGKNFREGRAFVYNKTNVVDPLGIAPFSKDLETGEIIRQEIKELAPCVSVGS